MKFRTFFPVFLTILLIIPASRALSQANISDEYLREKGMEELREGILDAIDLFIEQIDGLIEYSVMKRHSTSLTKLNAAGEFHVDDDSTKKMKAFRKARQEFLVQLDSLKAAARVLEQEARARKEEETGEFARQFKRIQDEMERLQKKLDKLQYQMDKYRQSVEWKYIDESKDVTRLNTDVTVGADEVIEGNLVVVDGDVRVFGTIEGNLIVTDGDIYLENGSIVRGDIICSVGDVSRDEKARVDGKIISESYSEKMIRVDEDDDDELIDSFVQRYPNSLSSSFPLQAPLESSFLRYNRVEGLYIGAAQTKKLYWISQPFLTSTGSLGYGFTSHTWRYSLGLYKPFYVENQIIEIGGEGHSLTDSKDQWIIGRDENSLMAFFAREDFMDYYTKRGFSVSLGWFNRFENGYQTRAMAAYLHDTYRSMDRGTNWSVFGGDKTFRENPAVNEANINSFHFSAGLSNVTKIWRSLEGWDVFAGYEIAGGPTKGDFQFTQFILDARRYQPLHDFINLNMRFRLGASDGTLPIQRTFDLGGVSTLPGYRFKEFTGSHVALANVEMLFNPSSAAGIRGWAASLLRSVNVILFADFGITNNSEFIMSRDFTAGAIDASFADGITDLTKGSVKSDAGVAIGSSDGDFRIGLAWRLDRSDTPNLIVRFTRPF